MATTTFLQQFAERLKALREERELSQKQLAAQAGVPLYMIVRCESAQSYHGLKNFVKLAAYFQLTTNSLFLGD